MEHAQSAMSTNVEAITADFRTVTTAYCECRRSGAQDYRALLAAIHAYRQQHPDISTRDATYAVSQLMRDLDRNALTG
jgi:hypothetical protein